MWKEFKEFITRGNVIDLAIALVIGLAFGKIITSFVSDILMPPLGLLLGKVDFANLFINLSSQHYQTLAEAKAAGAPTINYGQFINIIVEFLIVAFAVFLLVRAINRAKKKREEPVAPTKDCPRCITKIPLEATRCPACTSELTAAA